MRIPASGRVVVLAGWAGTERDFTREIGSSRRMPDHLAAEGLCSRGVSPTQPWRLAGMQDSG